DSGYGAASRLHFGPVYAPAHAVPDIGLHRAPAPWHGVDPHEPCGYPGWGRPVPSTAPFPRQARRSSSSTPQPLELTRPALEVWPSALEVWPSALEVWLPQIVGYPPQPYQRLSPGHAVAKAGNR